MRIFVAVFVAILIMLTGYSGYKIALLHVYRDAEFYIDDQMLMICLDGDYNETFYEVGWNREEYERRWR